MKSETRIGWGDDAVLGATTPPMASAEDAPKPKDLAGPEANGEGEAPTDGDFGNADETEDTNGLLSVTGFAEPIADDAGDV
jgi:hypothetical protein